MLGQEQDAFGGGFDQTQSLSGQIGGLRFWNRALSRTEVAALETCSLGAGQAGRDRVFDDGFDALFNNSKVPVEDVPLGHFCSQDDTKDRSPV